MESIRQMIGTIYLAFGNAVGEPALEQANKTILSACNSGAVDDVYARSALLAMVRSAEKKVKALA
jgi:hypothetical protein